MMKTVIVVIGPGQIGQAIARWAGVRPLRVPTAELQLPLSTNGNRPAARAARRAVGRRRQSSKAVRISAGTARHHPQ